MRGCGGVTGPAAGTGGCMALTCFAAQHQAFAHEVLYAVAVHAPVVNGLPYPNLPYPALWLLLVKEDLLCGGAWGLGAGVAVFRTASCYAQLPPGVGSCTPAEAAHNSCPQLALPARGGRGGGEVPALAPSDGQHPEAAHPFSAT